MTRFAPHSPDQGDPTSAYTTGQFSRLSSDRFCAGPVLGAGAGERVLRLLGIWAALVVLLAVALRWAGRKRRPAARAHDQRRPTVFWNMERLRQRVALADLLAGGRGGDIPLAECLVLATYLLERLVAWRLNQRARCCSISLPRCDVGW